jgi:hypothetical protein
VHPFDGRADFGRNRWPSSLLRLASPERLETCALPSDDGVGRDKNQRVAPPRPPALERDLEELIGVGDSRTHAPRFVRGELLPERDVLEDEVGVISADRGAEDAPEREDDEVELRMEHRAPGFVGAGSLECRAAGVKNIALSA